MTERGRDKVGTPVEYDLRDDDRPSSTAYAGRTRTRFGAVMVIGLLVAAALAYFLFQQPSGRPADPPPAVGSR